MSLYKIRDSPTKPKNKMSTNLSEFDEESKSVIKDLAEEGVNLDRLIKKLEKAKKKVNKNDKLAEALKENIKK